MVNNRYTVNLLQNYQRNIASRPGMIEDYSMLGPADVLALDQYQEQVPLSSLPQQSEAAATPVGKRGRKRKVALADGSIDEPSIVIRNASSAVDASLPVGQTEIGSELMPPPATPGGIAAADALTAAPAHTMDGDLPIPYEPTDIEPHVMAPSLGLSGMTPVGLHGDYPLAGMMTPHHHGIDQLESIPNLPADQVSSILNGTGLDSYSNMGFDDGHHADGGMSERIASDWNDDYDFPPSVGAHVSCHFATQSVDSLQVSETSNDNYSCVCVCIYSNPVTNKWRTKPTSNSRSESSTSVPLKCLFQCERKCRNKITSICQR